MSLKKPRQGKHEHGSKSPKRHMPAVPEKLARPTRTSLQYALGWWLGVQLNPHLPHVVDHQRVYVIGICLYAVNFVWVSIEDYFERGLLRAVPPKEVPAVDGKGDDELAGEPVEAA